MAYSLGWLVPDHLIYIRQYDTFTQAELYQYLDEAGKMRDEANTRVGVGGNLISTLTDTRDLKKMDMALKDVQHMLKTMRQQRVGWSIYVSHDAMNRFFASVAHQFVGVRHHIAPSMDKALAFLLDVDDTLPKITTADVDAFAQKISQPVK